MELMIGERLRRLRKSKGFTQDEIARSLGISFQAISKWERGEGYPDITMLPALANLFDVTVDELLGMDEFNAAWRLEDIHEKWQQNRAAGRHAENVTLMREALKDYPNNALLLMQLSTSLERLDGDEQQKREHLRESIDALERILRYCEDSEVRCAALCNISDAYNRYGDYEKAVEYAEKLPNIFKTRETALVYILKDDEKAHEISSAAIEPLAWVLSFHLKTLAKTEQDDRYREKILRLLDLLFEGKESEFVQSIRKKAMT